jgi:hypothetical protein
LLLLPVSASLAGCSSPRGPGSKTPRDGPPRPPISFVNGSQDSGVSQASYRWRGGKRPGFAAAPGDYDSDGKPDLLLAQTDVFTLFHNESSWSMGSASPRPGVYATVTYFHAKLRPIKPSGITYSGSVNGLCWGDYDNDKRPDVLLYGTDGVRIFRNMRDGKFQDVTAALGIRETQAAACAFWMDYDRNGRPDLFVSRDATTAPKSPSFRHLLYRNNSDGTFADISQKAGLKAAPPGSFALPFDFDQDSRMDVLLLAEDERHTLLKNSVDGTFSLVKRAAGLNRPGAARHADIADFNQDGRADLAVATNRGVMIAIHRPDNTFRIEPIIPPPSPRIVYSVAAGDFDRDGAPDVAALTANPVGMGQIEMRLYRNIGKGAFADVTDEAGLGMLMIHAMTRITLTDVEGDGSADIFVPGAQPLLLKNLSSSAIRQRE